MIIACPACKTRYAVPDSAIGVDGRTVRCAKCKHSWYQDGPPPERLADEAGAAVPTRPPPPPPTRPTPPPPPPLPPKRQIDRDGPTVEDRPQSREPMAGPGSAEPERAARSRREDPEPPPVSMREEETAGMPPPPVDAEPHAGETPIAEPPVDEPPVGHDIAEERDDGATPFDEEGYRPGSSFAHEPPFRPRRNWTRVWMIGAAAFALASLGVMGAISYWGMPEWMPVNRPTFVQAPADLVLEFPPDRQERRTLPNGVEYFETSGTVTNVGTETRRVPPIKIVLRDSRDRIVYGTQIVPPVAELAPGESVTVNEAIADVPTSAKFSEFGWAPF